MRLFTCISRSPSFPRQSRPFDERTRLTFFSKSCLQRPWLDSCSTCNIRYNIRCNTRETCQRCSGNRLASLRGRVKCKVDSREEACWSDIRREGRKADPVSSGVIVHHWRDRERLLPPMIGSARKASNRVITLARLSWRQYICSQDFDAAVLALLCFLSGRRNVLGSGCVPAGRQPISRQSESF